MKTSRIGIFAFSLAASLASAQYIGNTQYGQLPACAQNCAALTGPQSQCQSGDWACFCSGVWAQIEAAPTTICSASCATPADQATTYQWYNSNCGSDNGATAHGGSNAGTGDGNANGGNNNGGTGTSTASGSDSTSGTSSGSSSSGSSSSEDDQSWWAGHWKWIVMVIVLFFGLLALALLGLWLKKRHERKRDQLPAGGFNQGITERAPPMSSAHVGANDSAMLSQSVVDANGGRDSPARTREAFMPYGYGYTRSESRLGSASQIDRGGSPPARGTTPVGEIERDIGTGHGGEEATPSHKKSRRVMVRERSDADSSEDVSRGTR